MHHRRWLYLTFLVIVLDQLTKWLVLLKLSFAQPFPILPIFNLTLTYNTGVAFSFFNGIGQSYPWLFIGITFTICCGILVWLYRLPAQDKLLAAALSMVLGGALSNLLDRVMRGYVIDFLDFHWRGWHWPFFNLADSAVTIGAIILLIVMWKTNTDS